MLILGGIYLVVRGVIRVRVPVAFIATVAVLTFIFPLGGNDRLAWMAYNVFGGGLMLGAIFMATDYGIPEMVVPIKSPVPFLQKPISYYSYFTITGRSPQPLCYFLVRK